MTTNKRLKLVAAVARLDAKTRKQPRNERLRQQRQATAWQHKAAGGGKGKETR